MKYTSLLAAVAAVMATTAISTVHAETKLVANGATVCVKIPMAWMVIVR